MNKNSVGIAGKIHSVAIYSGAHPAHQKMLAGCCTDSVKMLGEWSVERHVSGARKFLTYASTALRLRNGNIGAIVIEGTTPTVLMAPFIMCCNRRPKSIISLCADDALYRTFVEANGVKRAVARALTRFSFNYVGGVIAVGDLTTRLIREHLKPLPIEVRYPPMAEPRVDEMAQLQPALDSHNIVLIGSGNAYVKGVDIATRCLEILREKFPGARLTILGLPGINEHPGLDAPGAVADIKPYLAQASVLIHPGRGDAFPVVILESMLAGVVPFLSEWTGALSIAQQIDQGLVVPLDAGEFAKRISSFWSATPDHRQALSDKCKRVAKQFTTKTAAQPSLRPFIERVASTKKSRG